MTTSGFAGRGRVDRQIAELEDRIAILERRVLLLLDLTTNLSDFCKGLREAVIEDDGRGD